MFASVGPSQGMLVIRRSVSTSPRIFSSGSTDNGVKKSNRANWEHDGEPFLASHKRGAGGRSSYSGITCTVFGSSGFVGRYVVNHLARMGTQMVIPFRGEQYWVRDMRLMGDLGQINFVPFHINDEDSIRKSMLYSNVVVNMIGAEFDTKNFTVHETNVNAARKIAKLARESGVKRLLHFSALNASRHPQTILLKEPGSQFLISKALGEEAVREEFPEAIIFRPSDIYGEEDRYLHYYRVAYRRMLRMMPLWKRGMETIKQPIYVGDVARGVAKAVCAPDSDGKVFEAVGPHRYYLGDLIDYMYSILRWFNGIEKIPITPLFKMQMEALSWIPTQRFPFSVDRLERVG